MIPHLNYQFQNTSLLQQALTRKSGLMEGLQEKVIGHNERLEFFGDGILRMVIDDILIELYPTYGEEQLSQERDKNVSKQQLAQIAEKLQLARFIIMGEGERQNFQKGGRAKILADTLEALIGAIFIDSQHNYLLIRNFICRLWEFQLIHDEQQTQKNQALFKAIECWQIDKAIECLSQGADPNTIGEHEYEVARATGYKSYDAFVETRQMSVLEMAIKGTHCLTYPTYDFKLIDALLRHSVDVNQQFPESKEPMLFSLLYLDDPHYGKLQIQLLERFCLHGMNVNFQNEEENTALHVAILNAAIFPKNEQTHNTVNLLIKYRTDPNLPNKKKETPLHTAAKWNQKSLIKKLLAKGADPCYTDEEGKRPSDYANDKALAQLLKKAETSKPSSHLISKNKKSSNLSDFFVSKADKLQGGVWSKIDLTV